MATAGIEKTIGPAAPFAFNNLQASPISLDELPQHSAWPAILLGLKSFPARRRTQKEVLREYDDEKWGKLLGWLQSRSHLTPEDLRTWNSDPEKLMPIAIGNRLWRAKIGPAMEAYEQWLSKTLLREGGDVLVELGCGVGDKLLRVGQLLQARAVFGGELTTSGVRCGQLLAQRWGIQAQFAHFDFCNPATLEQMPTGALVYTAHAVEQVPALPETFLEALLRRAPRKVVHFEPCSQDCDDTTMLGLLRKRYTDLNDYNRNLLTLLRTFEKRGKIQILEHQPAVFGLNPFNSTSLITWVPRES